MLQMCCAQHKKEARQTRRKCWPGFQTEDQLSVLIIKYQSQRRCLNPFSILHQKRTSATLRRVTWPLEKHPQLLSKVPPSQIFATVQPSLVEPGACLDGRVQGGKTLEKALR